MRSLWRILLAAATLMAFGTTLALGFDESGIDFANEDLATAYVGLNETGEGLTVFLSDTRTSSYVGTMDVEDLVNDFDNDAFDNGDIVKFLGARPWAPTVYPGLVQVAHASSWYRWIRVEHNQAVATVTAAYMARLGQLGYTVEEQPLTSNITAYTLTKGEENVRMVVVRRGGNTLVTLSRM